MTKILYVIPSLNYGGAEFETIEQCNTLSKRIDLDIYILILSNEYPLIEEIILPKNKILKLNIRHLTTTSIVHLWKYPLVTFKINNIIKKKQFDKIVSVGPISHNLIRLLQLKSNLFNICYHKSLQFQKDNKLNLIQKCIEHFFVKLGIKNDSAHIYISDAVKNNIRSKIRVTKHFLVYNAIREIKPENIKQIKDDYFGFNLSKHYVIVIPGRLHETKGHLFFLECLKEYLSCRELSFLKVIFAGDGPQKHNILTKISKFCLNDKVFISGTIPNNKMLSIINRANLIVIPSINEGLGNVAIESLMLGKTILASDAGGLPEIINHTNGFLFKKLDQKDFLEKLDYIIKNNVSMDSQKLIEDFHKRFSLTNQCDKLEHIFKL